MFTFDPNRFVWGPLILFVHIPRTGGTTLSRVAQEVLGDTVLAVYGDAISDPGVVFSCFTSCFWDQYVSMVRGHISYGFHERLGFTKRRKEYVTILRHPVSRLVSLYNYIRRDRGHYLYRYVKDLSFVDFVTGGLTCETNNGQCRQLCGTEGEFQQKPRAPMETEFGRDCSRLLEIARQNLTTFRVVGTTEKMGIFYVDLQAAYGWPTEMPRKTNASSGLKVGDLSQSEIDQVLQLNQEDLRLWEWTTERITQQGGWR